MAKAVLTIMEAPVPDMQEPPPKHENVDDLHLLITAMDDELAGYRWREAVWLSLFVHVLVFLALIFAPKWLPRSVILVPATRMSSQQTTFLELPTSPSTPKPPKTDIISDQNRIAHSRTPVPNRELLRKLLNAQPPGPPARPAPPQETGQQPTAQPAQQGSGDNSATPAQQQQQQTQTAHLEQPPQPTGPSPFKTALAPGAAISQAIQSGAGSHGATHMSFGGDYGPMRHQQTDVHGDVDILSDTMGVDFSGYLQRVIWEVKMHWYNLIPEVARPPIMKKGKLAIQFAILKDGSVSGMTLVTPSGDVALDRAAWGGISDSKPFQPLPAQFKGDFLSLRIKFYYNPDTKELE